METLDTAFMEMKDFNFPRSKKIKGFIKIISFQSFSMCVKILWELLTTFIVYSPSINNYLKDAIISVRKHWKSLSDREKENVIAALVTLNKHGKIEKALDKY